ncbi:MAG: FHA domain-containing protein [Chloroflexi bacterium]|nr:FHA domain-containing protein [Chloroflexota bacterium]
MRDKKRPDFSSIALILSLLWTLISAPVLAQEPSNPPFIAITGSDVTSPPLIDLHVYAADGQGNPLDLAGQTLTVKHNGAPAGLAELTGSRKAGTLTLFLIDIPPGVADQLPAIQDAIKQYASAPTMEETTDAVAVYQVGETAAAQLMAPDAFHNSVRNLFATPLEPELGATALVDSLGGLLTQVDALKPNPDMALAIVVMTDGTDVVSSQFDENEIAAQAAGLGIPIHTVWLTNENLSPASQQFGQDYLAEVAAGSRGLTARMQDEDDLTAIWNRIASFREQAVVSYPVEGLTGGEYEAELSLDGSLVAQDEATVSVPGALPMITINLPEESRELSLPDLDPIKLRFNADLSWLDGETRELVAAQLLVNGAAYDIPTEDIAQFDAEINNLLYDANRVQIAVLDAQGLRVTSPVVQLMVNGGAKSLPSELEPGGGFLAIAGRVFLLTLAVVGLGAALFYVWRQGWFSGLATAVPRGPSQPRPPVASTASDPDFEQSHQPMTVLARLEVLEAETDTPAAFALGLNVVKIGRSPAQSNIAFEEDITVSRLHASLHLEGRHYRIFDERSSSGIWVNDQKVPEYGIQLMDGDEIHLGAVHLRYRQP